MPVADLLGAVSHHTEITVDRGLGNLVVPAGDVEGRDLNLGVFSGAHLPGPGTIAHAEPPVVVVVRVIHQILPQDVRLAEYRLVHGPDGKVAVQLVPVQEIIPEAVVVVSRQVSQQRQKVEAVGELERSVGIDVVPVIVRSDVGNQSREVAVRLGGAHPLHESQIRAAAHPDFSRGPGLFSQPGLAVVDVLSVKLPFPPLRIPIQVGFPLGIVPSPHVDTSEHVTAGNEVLGVADDVALEELRLPGVVIRHVDEDNREFPFGLGPPDVGRQPDSVPHAHLDVVLEENVVSGLRELVHPGGIVAHEPGIRRQTGRRQEGQDLEEYENGCDGNLRATQHETLLPLAVENRTGDPLV